MHFLRKYAIRFTIFELCLENRRVTYGAEFLQKSKTAEMIQEHVRDMFLVRMDETWLIVRLKNPSRLRQNIFSCTYSPHKKPAICCSNWHLKSLRPNARPPLSLTHVLPNIERPKTSLARFLRRRMHAQNHRKKSVSTCCSNWRFEQRMTKTNTTIEFYVFKNLLAVRKPPELQHFVVFQRSYTKNSLCQNLSYSGWTL